MNAFYKNIIVTSLIILMPLGCKCHNMDSLYNDYGYEKVKIVPSDSIPGLPKGIILIDSKEMLPKEPVEEYAKFPGGDQALYEWTKSNMLFPAEAEKSSGIMLGIHITDLGYIDSVFIKSLTDPLIQRSALNLISKMPKWIPAKDSVGESVESWHMVYLFFTTPDLEKKQNEEWAKFTSNPDNLWDPRQIKPEFPGGERCMYQWLKKHTSQLLYDINGSVTLMFTVTSQGYIKDIVVKRGLSPEADAEAINIIENMPRWFPAYEPRKWLIDTQYILPIRFSGDKEI